MVTNPVTIKYIVPPASPSYSSLKIGKNYHYDVVIQSKGLLLELLSNVTQEVNIKVFEDLDIFEDSPIQQGSHLYFQILVKDSEYFLLIYLYSFLTV